MFEKGKRDRWISDIKSKASSNLEDAALEARITSPETHVAEKGSTGEGVLWLSCKSSRRRLGTKRNLDWFLERKARREEKKVYTISDIQMKERK